VAVGGVFTHLFLSRSFCWALPRKTWAQIYGTLLK
jgi:hypothetical protein